jgi:hypothetical protein
MVHPTKVPDAQGEWFEVYNTTARPLELQGSTFRNAFTAQTFTIVTSFIIPAKSMAVLGINGVPGMNGGVTVDYVYSGLNFPDSSAELRYFEFYNSGGMLIDRVPYIDKMPGRSRQLMPAYFDSGVNDNPNYWCSSGVPYGLGDFGTPKALNSASCPYP